MHLAERMIEMKLTTEETRTQSERQNVLEVKELSKEDPLYAEIRELYHDSFPDSERKPFEMIEDGVLQGKMEAWTVSCDDKLAGLAYVILGDRLNVLDYLAVHPRMRNHGAGAQILAWLDDHYGEKPLVVEIESTKDSTDDMICRRKNFYLRNRFFDCSCDFTLFGVRMELLSTDHPVSFEDYYAVMSRYFGREISQHIHRL